MALINTEILGQDDSDASVMSNRVMATIKNRGRDGSLPLLLGSVLLVWALRSFRNRTGRGALMGVVSVVLLGYGVRQRLSGSSHDDIETGADARRDANGSKRVSDEAHAEATQDLGAHRNADESASVHQSATTPNPRGMTDRSDTGDDEDEFDYVEGKDPGTHRETHLEDDDAHDTRLHPETDDEHTEVDVSEAAMADEASEATGPHPEQAYPAREGTDPEPTAEEAPEQMDAESSDTGDASSEGPDASESPDDTARSPSDDAENT